MKKVLIVVTNQARFPTVEKRTGLWISELTHFVNELDKHHLKYDLMSPKGGETPIDPSSMKGTDFISKTYLRQQYFVEAMKHTKRPSEVLAEDYDAIYFSGGHGTVYDFPDNRALQDLALKIYMNGGVVSAICHGVCALLHVKIAKRPLIQGKKITGFSNREESIAKLDNVVPFLLESELKRQGALYSKALLPGFGHVVVDDRLITGQNSNSPKSVAKKVIKVLMRKESGAIPESVFRLQEAGDMKRIQKLRRSRAA